MNKTDNNNLWRGQANNMIAELSAGVNDLYRQAKDCSDDLNGLESFIGIFSRVNLQLKITALQKFLTETFDAAVEGEVIYESAFDDTVGWGESNLSLFDNSDAVSDGTLAFNKTLAFSADNVEDEHGVSYELASPPNDKKKKVSLKYYIPAANTNVTALRVKFGELDETLDAEDTRITQDLTVIGAWTEVILNTTENVISIVQVKGVEDVFVGANSLADDLAYITDVRVVYLTR